MHASEPPSSLYSQAVVIGGSAQYRGPSECEPQIGRDPHKVQNRCLGFDASGIVMEPSHDAWGLRVYAGTFETVHAARRRLFRPFRKASGEHSERREGSLRPAFP